MAKLTKRRAIWEAIRRFKDAHPGKKIVWVSVSKAQGPNWREVTVRYWGRYWAEYEVYYIYENEL